MPASAMYFLKQYPFREVGKMNKGKKKERWERDIRLQLLTVHPLRVLEESYYQEKGIQIQVQTWRFLVS